MDTTIALDKSMFRAYDIRGIVGENLTEDAVYLIGKAYATLAQEQDEKSVVIARDGRLSGPKLLAALAQGLQAGGLEVINIGMVPTPVLYYATYDLPVPNGIMLTGSHNPANYNGLKMVLRHETLSSDKIMSLYHKIVAQQLAEGEGDYLQRHIVKNYERAIRNNIRCGRALRVVVDCGNGVAGLIAPKILRDIGMEVIELYCDVDGHFPNHHPDPSQIENCRDLIAAVQEHQADLGLAFDGDGDRLGVVTNAGTIIWPDRVLMLFAETVLQQHPGGSIIYDIKCTKHLASLITELGGEPIMWKTGHSFIKGKIKESNSLLAGEMSGHLFFNDRWFGFDDAIYAACRLVENLSQRTGTSEQIFAVYPNSINTPELKVAISDETKFEFIKQLIAKASVNNPLATITTLDGLRLDFPEGWGLVRPSNTTPYLICRFEADSEGALNSIIQTFRNLMASINPAMSIPW